MQFNLLRHFFLLMRILQQRFWHNLSSNDFPVCASLEFVTFCEATFSKKFPAKKIVLKYTFEILKITVPAIFYAFFSILYCNRTTIYCPWNLYLRGAAAHGGVKLYFFGYKKINLKKFFVFWWRIQNTRSLILIFGAIVLANEISREKWWFNPNRKKN